MDDHNANTREYSKDDFLARHATEIWTEYLDTLSPIHPLDHFLARYFKERPYLGARDRRSLSETTYARMRALTWPAHLKKYHRPIYDEAAPIAIRANTLKTTRDTLRKKLEAEGVHSTPSRLTPDGLLLDKRYPLQTLSSYREGCFELQDEGSQFISYLLHAQPNHKLLDACAGAGGKTLHLAALTQNQASIVAFDTGSTRLDNLKKRAGRAGALSSIHVVDQLDTLKKSYGTFDRVLIDAPCSGLGTLRRNPDLRLRISEGDLRQYHVVQSNLLRHMAPFVNTEGSMLYVTCSFSEIENENVIETFLKDHTDWMIEPLHALPQDGVLDHTDWKSFITQEGAFKPVPDETHTWDAYFAIRLRRR